jgi:hypothetical protein
MAEGINNFCNNKSQALTICSSKSQYAEGINNL